MRLTEEGIGGRTVLARLATGSMAKVLLTVAPPGRRALTGARPRLEVVHLVHRALAEDAAFRGTLVEELRAAQRLRHPSLVVPSEIGLAEEGLFFAARYVDGVTLRDLVEWSLRAGLSIPLEVLKRILREVHEALRTAHGARDVQGIPRPSVHGALDATSVLVTASGRVELVGLGQGLACARLESHIRPRRRPTYGRRPFEAPSPEADRRALVRLMLTALRAAEPTEALRVFRAELSACDGAIDALPLSDAASPGAVAPLFERLLARTPRPRSRNLDAAERVR